MNKQEFIDRLRAALNGRVSPGLVMENVNYYEDYINTQIRKGRNEAEILQTLGDPRLIARTIIETNNGSGQAGYESNDYQSTGYANNGYQGNNYRNAETGNYQQESYEKKYRLPGWVWAIVVIVIVVALLSAVLSVLSFLAPAIIAFAVVIFLVKLFRDWLN